jgi:hypothetical protein
MLAKRPNKEKIIIFRYKSVTKQIKIKTRRALIERMSVWLQGIFGMKHPIVGFKVGNSMGYISCLDKYYDEETFYASIDRFYWQVVEIVEAHDQL